MPNTVTRALFINSGILGQLTFAGYVRRAFATDCDGVRVVQMLVTEGLTVPERILRRLLCLRLWPADVPPRNIDLHRFRCELNAGLQARTRIRRVSRRGERFDVLHFHRQGTAYCSLDLMRRFPTIISCDSTQRSVIRLAESDVERRTYTPNVRQDGRIFRAARLIVSTSEWAAQSIRDEYPDCTTDITVMPNPVQLPPSSEGWAEERHRRATADSGYRPRVLFVGADFPRKGGYDLLRVWADARLGERATLDVVSNWAIDPASLPPGVTQHRRIVHHTPEWHALWRAADLFVLPTRDEAFGIVFQEAGAAALPAIGTRLNAVPEIVHDGETGTLVPMNDAGALAAAITSLLDAPNRRLELGLRARAFIASSADPDRYRRQLAQAIRRLAGHEPCVA
jgi:starch synthase